MNDYLSLGSVPSDEQCANVGDANYQQQSVVECNTYKAMLSRLFPVPEKAGVCYFITKNFPHELGSYKEVVIRFNDDNPDAVEFALYVEHNIPAKWDSVALAQLHGWQLVTEIDYCHDEELVEDDDHLKIWAA